MYLKLSESTKSQNEETSFFGGKPRLPLKEAIPTCKLCGSKQTFFFQVAIPEAHELNGMSVACFSCTKCVDENYLIPEMINSELKGADIPSGFLDSYQRNFSFLVFDTDEGVLNTTYEESLEFKALEMSDKASSKSVGQIGGEAKWLLDDESPSSYEGASLKFLLQLNQGLEFKKTDGAEPQMELNIFGEPEASPLDHYQLFLGNALYLFATNKDKKVYAITQV